MVSRTPSDLSCARTPGWDAIRRGVPRQGSRRRIRAQTWVPSSLPGFDAARPGDTVTLRADPDGVTCTELRTDRPSLWTYLTRVQRTVDGDTVAAVADLGLGHRAFPRLRLRGIDCPEVYTQAGRRAKDFVTAALAQVGFVVISTRLTDINDRYLADVRYLPNADPQIVLTHGTYLNRQLLVQRVVDGDTFIGAVDLGLGQETWTLRFRLASIDTPELSTLAGRNARDFTTDALSRVDFVIVRTHRTDDYGRYLVDVRYLPGEPDPDVVRRNGLYLNRQLLEERLARRYAR